MFSCNLKLKGDIASSRNNWVPTNANRPHLLPHKPCALFLLIFPTCAYIIFTPAQKRLSVAIFLMFHSKPFMSYESVRQQPHQKHRPPG